MAKEYGRAERVADYLKRELATLLQFEVRDPRVGMVSITDIEVSKNLSHARVYCTVLGKQDEKTSDESLQALNRAAGFMRSRLAKDSAMRTVPQLRFYFDASVSRGVYMEDLIERAVATDSENRSGEHGQ